MISINRVLLQTKQKKEVYTVAYVLYQYFSAGKTYEYANKIKTPDGHIIKQKNCPVIIGK